MFDIEKIRLDFPILQTQVNQQPLVYLDSAATSQKPQSVIDATQQFYQLQNANVHRGKHFLSEQATLKYEQARALVAEYFQVTEKEIVWTKGATESVNLIAHGLKKQLQKGDKIAISVLEHHANIVPWQQIAAECGCEIIVLPFVEQRLDARSCADFIIEHAPAVVAVTQAANSLGNITDLVPIINACKQVNAISVIDGAQSALHLKPNLTELDCDFFVFSAHKMLGPTGVGGVYGRYECLNRLAPYQTGGEMIEKVTLTQTTFRQAPAKFEAGTPNIAGVIAFAEAIKYLNKLDISQCRAHELALLQYLVSELKAIDGITLYGDDKNNIGNISFNYRNEHPFDLATLLDHHGVAVRSGHHCAQPVMQALNIAGTVRVSLAFYNNINDIDTFITALKDCISLLD